MSPRELAKGGRYELSARAFLAHLATPLLVQWARITFGRKLGPRGARPIRWDRWKPALREEMRRRLLAPSPWERPT